MQNISCFSENCFALAPSNKSCITKYKVHEKLFSLPRVMLIYRHIIKTITNDNWKHYF